MFIVSMGTPPHSTSSLRKAFMDNSVFWREILFSKHAQSAEHAQLVLIIALCIAMPVMLFSAFIWLCSSMSFTALFSYLSWPLTILALIYLVFSYHVSHLAWYGYNARMCREGTDEMTFLSFFIKYFPLVLVGKRNF